MSRTKNNKLIAKFVYPEQAINIDLEERVYFETPPDDSGENIWLLSELRYDKSWDWLMPVVEKIEELEYFCMISKWTTVYTGAEKEGDRISITTVEGENKLVNTYQAVLAFINWYNKKKL